MSGKFNNNYINNKFIKIFKLIKKPKNDGSLKIQPPKYRKEFKKKQFDFSLFFKVHIQSTSNLQEIWSILNGHQKYKLFSTQSKKSLQKVHDVSPFQIRIKLTFYVIRQTTIYTHHNYKKKYLGKENNFFKLTSIFHSWSPTFDYIRRVLNNYISPFGIRNAYTGFTTTYFIISRPQTKTLSFHTEK